MVVFPIDKYLAQDYRNTLRTGDSPQNLDTDNPVLPVIDIQKGFPTPNSKQVLKFKYLSISNSNVTDQLAIVTSSTRVYFVGLTVTITGTAGLSGIRIGDLTAGTPSITSGNTENMVANFTALGNLNVNMPLPIKANYGLRAYLISGAASQIDAVVYWIEEAV